GFHEVLVQRLLRGEGSKLCLPPDQQVAVVMEDPDTVGYILLLGIRRESGRLRQSDRTGRRLVRAESEVLGQLPGSLETAEVKQAGSEVDDIAGSPAAEAVIIGVIQLHAGGMVLVERAVSHPGGRNGQAVQSCGLLDRDGFLDQFKKIHLHLAIYWWCWQMYLEPQYMCPVGFPPFRSNLCRSPSSLLTGNRSFLRALCHPFRALAPGGGRRGLGGEDGHSLICEGYYNRKIP